MSARLITVALALCACSCAAVQQREASMANPIRKVVTMLQAMQAKVAAEGEKEKELYDKFMCYCQTNGGDLQQSIADAAAKVPELGSEIKESEEQMAQLKQDIETAKADREAAKQAIAEASAIRQKEADAFAAEKADSDANIEAISKAVAALEKGMAGSFLQTQAASVLRKLALSSNDMLDADRQDLLAFLSNNNDYSPQSGQIVGILKTMEDEMAKGLSEATAQEEAAIKAYEALVAAKKKQIQALTQAIETKLVRVGDLGVSIQEAKNDLGDTEQALLEDKKFLEELEKGCDTKKTEFDERTKTRAEELVALADTIKVLNDDDALELFKKTLPSASSSFVQVTVSEKSARLQALAAINEYRQRAGRPHQLDFIALALHGSKVGFDKVISMIDSMVETLKKEQQDDEAKKESCGTELDSADDKKKSLEHSISDLDTLIEDTKSSVAALASDMKALEASIKSLDQAVAEATENRKAENEEYKALVAADTAAKELLGFAKNRLNKFYNPRLYRAPPKKELTDEDRAVLAAGGSLETTPAPGGIAGTGISALQKAAPPPPPETWGAYQKKSSESNGVIAMIDLLVKDLDKELTEAEAEEKNAQEDYAGFMASAAESRSTDSKSLTDKAEAKANAESALVESSESKASAEKELGATLKSIEALHLDCDWLLKFFDTRAEARASEIDALGKAKAVLSGADYSLLQTRDAHRSLRGVH